MAKKGLGVLFAFGRAYWQQFRDQNKKIDIKLPGVGFSVPLGVPTRPTPTRRGDAIDATGEFYSSHLGDLYGWYGSDIVNDFVQRRLAYVDFVEFKSRKYNSITFEPIDLDTMKVKFLSSYYKIPPTLVDHAKCAVDMFKATGRLHRVAADTEDYENNQCARIVDFSRTGVMKVERARYFDQVGTNLSLDWASGHLGGRDATIRSDIEPPRAGRLPPLSESVLANTLGVAVMFLGEDLRPILRVRNPAEVTSIRKKGLHCTVSGVFEVPIDRPSGDGYGFEFFDHGVELEVANETGLEREDFELIPIGFARELPRGGKPQMFWLGVTSLGEDELRARAAAAKEAYEFRDGEGIEVEFAKDVDLFRSYEEKFTYEGFMMLYLADKFVSANEAKLKQTISDLKDMRRARE